MICPEGNVYLVCTLQGDAEENFWDIPRDRLEKTFMVNIVGMISLAQKAIHHMQAGKLQGSANRHGCSI